VATKSAQPEPVKAEVIEEALDALDTTLDRVKVLYEQYFLGIQKQPPTYLHTDIERKLRDVAQLQIRNTALRYRFATLQQKFGSYNSYWRRTLRQIENGTYTRNLFKIGRQAARTGADVPPEILAAMPKRMRDQVMRDREAALALARLREKHPTDDLELLTLVDEDVDIDVEDLDLDSAVIEESSELRRDALAGGAYKIDESDADFDLDAFFSAVTNEDGPEIELRAPGARKRSTGGIPVVGRAPTLRSEPRPPEDSQRGHPRPGSLSGSPIAALSEDLRVPGGRTRRSSRAGAGRRSTGQIRADRGGAPPQAAAAAAPPGNDAESVTEVSGTPRRSGKSRPPGKHGSTQALPRVARTPAAAPPANPVTAPSTSQAAAAAPPAPPQATRAIPPIVPTLPQATRAIPSAVPTPPQATRAIPSVGPKPPETPRAVPPAPPPQATRSIPSIRGAAAPSQATRSIPVAPGAAAGRSTPPAGSTAAAPAAAGPSQATRSIPAPGAPAPSQATRSIPVVPGSSAPSQATRSIPVAPGSSAVQTPVPVESMAGPFPRIPSIPSVPSIPSTSAGLKPAVAPPRPPSAKERGAVPRIITPLEPSAPVESERDEPTDVMSAAVPERRPPARPAGPGANAGAPQRPTPPRERPIPPSERRQPDPPQAPPPGMSNADVNALYAKYVKAKEILGEEAGPGAYGKLLKTINAQAPKIMEQYNAKGVDFSVVVKDNQVIIRAKPKP
jgi:hypothetical protein